MLAAFVVLLASQCSTGFAGDLSKDEGCRQGARMVASFAKLRDAHKPIEDVDRLIDTMPTRPTPEWTEFLKKLARSTYKHPDESPDEMAESFMDYCTTSMPPGA